MYKYLAVLALPLLGCAGHHTTVRSCPSEVVIDPHPVKVEMEYKHMEQAMACSDDFDCLNKLTGICPNGYSGTRNLLSESQRRVGVVFHCITDEEKAEIQRR